MTVLASSETLGASTARSGCADGQRAALLGRRLRGGVRSRTGAAAGRRHGDQPGSDQELERTGLYSTNRGGTPFLTVSAADERQRVLEGVLGGRTDEWVARPRSTRRSASRASRRSPRRRPRATGRRASRRPARRPPRPPCGCGRSSPRASTCRSRSGRDGGSAAREMRMCTSRGPGVAQHLHDLARGVAAHDRVVHDDDALAGDDLGQRVELQPQAVLAQLLAGLDEGARDVAVLDQPVVLREARRRGRSRGRPGCRSPAPGSRDRRRPAPRGPGSRPSGPRETWITWPPRRESGRAK